jgi:Na+/H+ antiporter NhaD/arsenite permease-like protein
MKKVVTPSREIRSETLLLEKVSLRVTQSLPLGNRTSGTVDGKETTVVTIAPVPVYMMSPFVLVLAAIALLPQWKASWWTQHRHQALVMAALSLPAVLWCLVVTPASLLASAHEYVSFLCLLGALFVIAGGIHIAGDLRGTPTVNTLILAAGAVLASILGTTGASMVLIRLLLRTNSQRRHTGHMPFFFILIVANCGGLLTPLGDPPLFLGYLHGVPFVWTLRLLPIWLATVAYLLGLFFLFDRRAYRREASQDLARDSAEAVPLRIHGASNLWWLLLVIVAIFLSSPVRELVMVAAAMASWRLGSRESRERNDFEIGPIREVAVLFAGIFATMVPALRLLEQRGPGLGLVAPWHFFLAAGSLSSVLDNAPTYLTFLTTAQSTTTALSLPAEVVGIPGRFLAAISAGAVLMGANTYIGNGPNLMVKAIADRRGYRCPSFSRYSLLAITILSPIYLTIALLIHRF